MAMRPIAAMIRKDLQLFFTDRRAVIMSIVAPIAIASFFGSVFSGGSREPARIPVAIVDQDGSAISKAILAGAQTDRNLRVSTPTSDDAREEVRKGRVAVAVLIPGGFGDAAGRAFFSAAEKPNLSLWFDPSRQAELAMVRGILTEHVMQSVSAEMFSGEQGRVLIDDTLQRLDRTGLTADQQGLLRDLLQSARKYYGQRSVPGQPTPPSRGLSLPYTVAEEAITSGANVAYNGYAHSFAGMAIQFLLFASIDLGVGVLLERQRGLWKRLRSAPVSRVSLLAAKTASAAIVALMTLAASFVFAMLVFHVRIAGSLPGFILVALATAAMAATFGLLIAALGRTPGGTRGIASLAVLLMVMLGGAWVPSFIFPAWLQRLTVVIPARWAVDGFDAMTWRGLGLGAALTPAAVMLGFAVLFGALAVSRFEWEEP